MHTTLIVAAGAAFMGLATASDTQRFVEDHCREICCNPALSDNDFCRAAIPHGLCTCPGGLVSRRDYGWPTVTVTPEWCVSPPAGCTESTSLPAAPQATTSCSTTTKTFSRFTPQMTPASTSRMTTATFSGPSTVLSTSHSRFGTLYPPVNKTATMYPAMTAPPPSTTTPPLMTTSCQTLTSTVHVTPTVYIVSKGSTISTSHLAPTTSYATTIITTSIPFSSSPSTASLSTSSLINQGNSNITGSSNSTANYLQTATGSRATTLNSNPTSMPKVPGMLAPPGNPTSGGGSTTIASTGVTIVVAALVFALL
ncbi:hypothetical protein B0A50_06027 [Salinomyces thailandicus]|uniref:Cell wall protein n=1 Tax=Salinomyces thailandicus TaxID=706561 RepID=A0A4U0TQ85_9PEZI|nr:hypothetical protein B0A50_06027 [Salinomyces thailandica]